ncbi:MAG TPA: hypothetical protein DCE76_02060 [Anaerolineaceae bacterium]|nr:hypothetical protein [Anaerolineaceae bacterium]
MAERIFVANVRLTEREYKALRFLAARDAVTVSAWLRGQIRKELKTLGLPVSMAELAPLVESEVRDERNK